MDFKTTLAAFATIGLLSAAAPAFAQSGDCTADTDCPDGFTCETSDFEYCWTCAEGEDCEPGCESKSDSYCVPPPPQECDDTNSCSGDDVCVTYTFEECSGGRLVPPCPEGESCDDDPEEVESECTTSSESYCVPPYLAPCSADADCGAGFTCEDVEICTCSGGGSTGSDDQDPAPEPTESKCSCDATGEKYCQLVEQTCDSDADCASGLNCQQFPGDDTPPTTTIDCPDDKDCTQPEPQPEPESYCAPPDFVYWGGPYGDGGGYGEAVAEATGNDDASYRSSEREEFFPVDGSDSDGDAKSEPRGCSTADGSGSGASMLLLLLGLGFARRRRS